MNASAFAMLALIPMISGPLPETERSITTTMCGGGEITIPLGDKDGAPKGDCHQKACHAASCREKTKRNKLI